MKLELEHGTPVLYVSGRITTNNAAKVEKEINTLLADCDAVNLILDLSELEFISSVGIRIILRLAKKFGWLTVRDCQSEVYSVLEMTGLTKIITVTRALRDVSPDGAPIIGKGFAGTVYRLSDDLILKLYAEGITRDMVVAEKSRAEKAFLHDIPTAVSYDVVKHGKQFGIVFELMNAKNLAEVFAAEPERFEDIIRHQAQFLRKLNATTFEADSLPSMKDNYKWRIAKTVDFLSHTEIQTLNELIDAIPDRKTFLHGDFHPKNIMLSGDEFTLIDMADVALGHPIFDLTVVYFSCKHSTWGHPEMLPQIIGFDVATAEKYLNEFFKFYLEPADDKFIARTMELAAKLSWLRILLALPYLTMLPPDVPKGYVKTARQEFFPTAKNLVSDYRDVFDAL